MRFWIDYGMPLLRRNMKTFRNVYIVTDLSHQKKVGGGEPYKYQRVNLHKDLFALFPN